MTEYLFWALFAFLGLGGGWLMWGRAVAPTKPELSVSAGKPKRTIRRPKSDKALPAPGASPFRVVTLDGNVRYDGPSGADARRSIELLRSQDVEWRAYRNGQVWDWGPRDV